jgi:hypothetical protein
MPFPDISAWYSGEEAARTQLSSTPPQYILDVLAQSGFQYDPARYAWDGQNIIDRTTGQQYWQGGIPDPSQGTNVVYGTGATEQFGPGENPHFFLSAGDNYANQGGVAAAVPGSELYNQLSDDARTRSLRGVAQVGALVGGAAALGNTAWGQGGTTTGSGSATVSGSNAFAGASGAGGADLGGMISAGMGPQGVVGGAGAGGFVGGGAAASGLSRWLPHIGSGVNTLLNYRAAGEAADIEGAAIDRAIAEQARQYDTTRNDLMPWLDAGRSALGRLNDPTNNFTASPDYAFRRSEGTRDIGNTFAARGMGQSGNALRALNEFNSALASDEYGNWWNRQAGLAGVGQTTGAQLGQLGQNNASNIGNYLQNQGVSRASGVLGRYGSIADGLSEGITNHLYRRQRRVA